MKNKFTWQTILLIILITVFITLTINVLQGNTESINNFVYQKIAVLITPPLTQFFLVLSFIGNWPVYVSVSLIFLVIPKFTKTVGLPASIVLASSALLNILLKTIFHIDRPDINQLAIETGFGYPSGHAMTGTAYTGIIAYLLCRYFLKGGKKITVIISTIVFMMLIGLARIYLGVHSVSDVAGGFLAGSALLLSAVLLINKISK